MKVLGFLAVLAAGFLGVAVGSANAMPVKFSFSGSILSTSECSAFATNCSPSLFEPSPGGVFAGGQKVTGSFIYDTSSLAGTFPTTSGETIYQGTVRDFNFSVATGSGPYAFDLRDVEALGQAQICGVPECSSALFDQRVTITNGFVNIPVPPDFVGPPPVAGAGFVLPFLSFFSDKDLLASNALLPAEELLSFAQQSERLFGMFFVGGDNCTAEDLCFVVAKVSVSVPEPSGVGLLSIGIVGMIALRRRKKAAA